MDTKEIAKRIDSMRIDLKFLLDNLTELSIACRFQEEQNDGWISVKDKLPDECEDVLIYCPEFVEEIKRALYTEGDFFVEKDDLIVKPAPNGYCTHWMHHPKPPKGE